MNQKAYDEAYELLGQTDHFQSACDNASLTGREEGFEEHSDRWYLIWALGFFQ